MRSGTRTQSKRGPAAGARGWILRVGTMPASPTSPTRTATRGLCKNAVTAPDISAAVVVPRRAHDCLRLVVVVVAIPVALEKAAPLLRQRHCRIAIAGRERS